MAKKDKVEHQENTDNTNNTNIPKITDLEWTDYVLSLLSEDEKIMGNPTTDGLRRVFEIAMNARIIASNSQVLQCPSPKNEKRATVCHSLTFCLNDGSFDKENLNLFTVDGSADVYWGNCDKVFRNHPVAVAETRAEGRALRRALRLRKVVAAEEIAKDIEDHPDENTVSKISNNQINFMDVISQRLNIDMNKLFEYKKIKVDNIYDILHDNAVDIIRLLSKYQQNIGDIPADILGYNKEWK